MANRDEVERSRQELVEGHLGDPTPAAPAGHVRVDAGVADMLQLRRML